MKLKKSKKTNKNSSLAVKILGLLLIVTVILVTLIFIGLDLKKDQTKGAQSVAGIIENSDDYKSLDLKIASKATYSSSPITVSKQLAVENNVDHQVVQFKVTKDGLSESALMTLPTTPKPAKGFPVIILCHGYVNPVFYRTEKAYLGDMEYYSQHGFVVIKPDFRGQGFSIGQGSPDGAYYSMAYNTDVLSLVAAVKQTKTLDKNNINLWGHSMGAYIALRASVLSPDIKHTILLSGPVGYIQDMFNSYVAISDTNNAIAGALRLRQLSAHGTPNTNPTFWNNTSPINFLSNSKTFYQIHTGSLDQIVPTHLSADLDQALTKVNLPHEYFVYPRGEHGLGPERTTIWARSLSRLTTAP